MTNAALLVIDVQREYMEPEPFVTCDGNDLIDKCRALIETARGARVPVVFVRHLDKVPPADPALAEICPEIAPRNEEAVVEKRFASAFLRTNLEETLRHLRAKSLYVCGLATYGCLNATVMCALCKDYDVVVAHDAHGARPLGDITASQVIVEFESTWVDAGAKLLRVSEIRFSRQA
jgi:nicotinamidase-related amidase